nr:WIAG-tail domain [Paenibacillus sp. ACRRX]
MTEHLATASISTRTIRDGAIKSEHVQEGAIQGQHLQKYAVTAEHCNYSPVRTAATKRTALQQFGTTPFELNEVEDRMTLTVYFQEPYDTPDYVLVAMTNHEECYAVLAQRWKDSADISIVRRLKGGTLQGHLSWIVIS